MFHRESCIVVNKGTVCAACAEACPTAAVRMVPYRDALYIPETHDGPCIGCGACEHACPSRPERAIIVRAKSVHGTAEAPAERPIPPLEKETTGNGFAF